MTISQLKTPALLIILLANHLDLKFSSPTQLEDIKSRNSEKLFALSSKDWLDLCNSTVEILAKRSKPSELWDMPLKSFIFWLEETHSKSSLNLYKLLVPEKIPQESEEEVLFESKPLMFLLWEESTRQFIYYLLGLGIRHLRLKKPLQSALQIRSLTVRRVTTKVVMPLKRRKKLRKLLKVIVDRYKLCQYFLWIWTVWYDI